MIVKLGFVQLTKFSFSFFFFLFLCVCVYFCLGWTKTEAIDSLMRKAGYNGTITESLRKHVRLTRYQSTLFTMQYSEYVAYIKATRGAAPSIVGAKPGNHWFFQIAFAKTTKLIWSKTKELLKRKKNWVGINMFVYQPRHPSNCCDLSILFFKFIWFWRKTPKEQVSLISISNFHIQQLLWESCAGVKFLSW